MFPNPTKLTEISAQICDMMILPSVTLRDLLSIAGRVEHHLSKLSRPFTYFVSHILSQTAKVKLAKINKKTAKFLKTILRAEDYKEMMAKKIPMSQNLINNLQNLQAILIKGFATPETSDKNFTFFISSDASESGGGGQIYRLKYTSDTKEIAQRLAKIPLNFEHIVLTQFEKCLDSTDRERLILIRLFLENLEAISSLAPISQCFFQFITDSEACANQICSLYCTNLLGQAQIKLLAKKSYEFNFQFSAQWSRRSEDIGKDADWLSRSENVKPQLSIEGKEYWRKEICLIWGLHTSFPDMYFADITKDTFHFYFSTLKTKKLNLWIPHSQLYKMDIFLDFIEFCKLETILLIPRNFLLLVNLKFGSNIRNKWCIPAFNLFHSNWIKLKYFQDESIMIFHLKF